MLNQKFRIEKWLSLHGVLLHNSNFTIHHPDFSQKTKSPSSHEDGPNGPRCHPGSCQTAAGTQCKASIAAESAVKITAHQPAAPTGSFVRAAAPEGFSLAQGSSGFHHPGLAGERCAGYSSPSTHVFNRGQCSTPTWACQSMRLPRCFRVHFTLEAENAPARNHRPQRL